MKRNVAGVVGVAGLALVAACSRNPQPAATTPAASAAQEQAARDSMAREQARKDSLARLARADSIARAQQLAQSHADSVRSEVMRETVAPSKDVTNLGLSASDETLMKEQIHFDYNKSDLKATDLALLQQKLGILQAHPYLVVQIAGNCDERGSDEYNMALGERRAAAAQRWLQAHGIAADRITIVSYGEERPSDPGHDEAAWAKNRRDDFVLSRRVD
jgi:peptidoglycan-associated lipoprotein